MVCLLSDEEKNVDTTEETNDELENTTETKAKKTLEDSGKTWEQVLHEMSDLTPNPSLGFCWNCKARLKGNEWCDVCRRSIDDQASG